MSKSSPINQLLPPFHTVIVAEIVAAVSFILLYLLSSAPLNILIVVPLFLAGLMLVKVGSQTITERIWNFIKFSGRLILPKHEKKFPVLNAEVGTARIGIQWCDDTLISALRVIPQRNHITTLEPNKVHSSSHVDISAIAKCLNQFDIVLSDIDIVTTGYQVWGETADAQAYRSFLGPLACVSHREMWIILHLKPFDNATAIAIRGGGQKGTIKTMATATRRVALKLNTMGVKTEFITSEQLSTLPQQFFDGIPVTAIKEKWSYTGIKKYRFYCYAINPKTLTTTNLDKLWNIPSQSTLVKISLKNLGKDSIAAYGILKIGDYKNRKRRKKFTTLYSLIRGNQYKALTALLPSNRSISTISPLLRKGDPEAYQEVHMSTSGFGQILGTNEHGMAVALPIVGPEIERVDISAELQLVKQILIRTLAIGAKVLVCSLRPQLWQSMIDTHRGQDNFVVVDAEKAQNNSQLTLGYNAVVIDTYAPSFSLGSQSTLIHLHELGTDLSTVKSDVQLIQDPQELSSIYVSSGSNTVRVYTVVTQQELAQTGI